MDTLQKYSDYLPYLVAYIFVYLISARLIEYLSSVGKSAIEGQKVLYEKFIDNYNRQAYASWKKYKDTVAELGKERSYHTNLLVISGILLIVNSFVLSAFLDNIGGLKSPIIIDPLRINYSHLVAAAIVLVEIATGIVYYIGHSNQTRDQDNPVYATLKFLSLIAFISLLVVEVIMWVRVSILFNMAENLGISENNVFRDFINYFLGALGVGFTMTEFAMGYFLTMYSQFGQNSFVSNFGRYFLTSSIFIVIYYIPYIILIPLSYLCIITVHVLKLLIIPGDVLFEKFNKN
jgi:hypothetical protein